MNSIASRSTGPSGYQVASIVSSEKLGGADSGTSRRQRDAFEGVRKGAAEAISRRAAAFDGLIGAARLLAGMIEKMGGTATSMPRGTYVNLTV